MLCPCHTKYAEFVTFVPVCPTTLVKILVSSLLIEFQREPIVEMMGQKEIPLCEFLVVHTAVVVALSWCYFPS